MNTHLSTLLIVLTLGVMKVVILLESTMRKYRVGGGNSRQVQRSIQLSNNKNKETSELPYLMLPKEIGKNEYFYIHSEQKETDESSKIEIETKNRQTGTKLID